MADWKKVTHADGKTLWINMSLATAMIPEPGKGTVIVFDKENRRTVRENVEKLREKKQI